MTTKPVRPRHLVHRGVVEAAGFLFDLRRLPLQEARRRILTLWSPGALVYRVPGDGLFLRLPAPLRVVCERAPGLPCVTAGPVLLAAPLSPEEVKALDPPAGAVVLVSAGVAVVELPGEEAREDVVGWLDLSGWQAVETTSLGSPIPALRLLADPVAADPRAALKAVPPEAPERRRVLAALRAPNPSTPARAGKSGSGPGLRELLARRLTPLWRRIARPAANRGAGAAQGKATPTSQPPRRAARRGPLSTFLTRLAARLGSRRPVPASTSNQSGTTAPVRMPIAGDPPALSPLAAWMRRLAARLLVTSGLAESVGRRQAEYIGRMMEMFTRGDLDQALRHAIPLSTLPGSESTVPALSAPSPRSELNITPQQSGTRSGIALTKEIHEDLRSLYRTAFQRLETQERIEEAAFVLAELLEASEEAVAFLERHGKLRLAAEIAEARRLPPGLIVRQWFLAGERERAVRIARRTGAFSDAIVRLERTDREQANALRRCWGEELARAGDYVTAVEVVWPIPEARTEALVWMERTIEIGGPAGARMLARKLVSAPDAFEEVRQRVLELLDADGPDAPTARLAFVAALCKEERAPAVATLDRTAVRVLGPEYEDYAIKAQRQVLTMARAAVRALVRDSGQGQADVPTVLFQQLVELAADTALRADIPALSQQKRAVLRERATPLEITVAPADVGTLALYDAAYLPGGRCVVALGEAGARLLSWEGRAVAHFDQPAHRLVVSDQGDRAIAIAPRGDVQRLARLDFATRRASTWCEARLGAVAPDYDGSLWFAASGDDFLAVDATAERADALWRTPSVGGAIVSIARSAAWCSFLLRARPAAPDPSSGPQALVELLNRPADEWWRWTHQLPALYLRDRMEVKMPQGALPATLQRGVSPQGVVADAALIKIASLPDAADDIRLCCVLQAKQVTLMPLATAEHTPLPPVVQHDWAAVPTRFSGGICCHLIDLAGATVRARLTLGGAERASVRLTPRELVLADDRGRLLVLDLERGALLLNLRVH